MSDLRKTKITANGQYFLVGGSITGREVVTVYGVFNGATVEIQEQIVLDDGSLSAITTIPDPLAIQTSGNFKYEVAIGQKNNLLLNVTNKSGSGEMFVDVSPLD